MSIRSGASIEEVAYEVCTALNNAGTIAVLSGGAAATVHAPEAYETRDLDFILQLGLSGVNADPILALGFRHSSAGGTYAHPEIPFTLEFPPGPLAVGGDVVTSWETLRKTKRILHIISATDCVRDRLAAAIHWNDFNSLEQAVAVARRQTVDHDAIARWCEREGGARQHSRFVELLGRS